MFKVLVVDDSVVYRKAISMALENEPSIEVVGSAPNGKIAIERIKQFSPDLITLDLEMPVMDGLATIKEIRKFNKDIRILIFSSVSVRGANITFDALSSGADDFLTKSNIGAADFDESIKVLKSELVPKIIQFKSKSPVNLSSTMNTIGRIKSQQNILRYPKAIGIGSSTGGPETLKTIFKSFSANNFIPILIAQHMPKLFTKQLAGMLDGLSSYEVKEGEDGEVVKNNTAYIAPGDFHMEVLSINNNYVLKMNQKEKLHFVRPAVDYLFESMAKTYKESTMAFILTGMGEDGYRGVEAMKQYNVQVGIQDEQSATVWGMPGAVYERSLQDRILTPEQISQWINEVNMQFMSRKVG
ncbi:MAG: chemotaxis-specific protein-glutamate methyltransferase CheB [Bdellovibrionaceae bacterium]|nr:chemotaxis-specific protein-glutamate methyltransferase CheB [Pseudobdellovibrionaceae bacterium]